MEIAYPYTTKHHSTNNPLSFHKLLNLVKFGLSMNPKPVNSHQYKILKGRLIEAIVSIVIDLPKLWFGRPLKDIIFINFAIIAQRCSPFVCTARTTVIFLEVIWILFSHCDLMICVRKNFIYPNVWCSNLSSERVMRFVNRLEKNVFISMKFDNHPSDALKLPIFSICDEPQAMSLSVCQVLQSFGSLKYNAASTISSSYSSSSR